MPTISRFFGITIPMYYDDHAAPDFDAYYGEESAKIAIQTLSLLAGRSPRRARALVIEWASEHREELLDNWRLAENHQPLMQIEPLE